jgi:hypothetical protein
MNESDDMTCAGLADMAAELALGVLTGRERAMAVAHLDTCDACREDVRQLMETGEQLRGLLPPVEPPAGFETRVLARLGLSAPVPQPVPEPGQPEPGQRQPQPGPSGAAGSGQGSAAGNGPGHRRPAPGAARPGGDHPGGDRPGGGRPGKGPRRPGSRLRRAVAAAAVGLAVVVAGLSGWRIGEDTAPAGSTAPGALSSVALLTASRQNVGTIYLYSGPPRWMYMSVDVAAGSEVVTCQLVGANGQVHTLGSFRLTDGYGAWGSPDPGNVGDVWGARLVSAGGTVLATAAFTHW